jgi:hypothetical protein
MNDLKEYTWSAHGMAIYTVFWVCGGLYKQRSGYLNAAEFTPTTSGRPIVDVTTGPIVDVSTGPIVDVTTGPIVDVSTGPIVDVTTGPIVDVSTDQNVAGFATDR